MYTYNWPGNVRELRNLIERVTILSANESKENINKLINDILINKSNTESNLNIKSSFSSTLKEARKQFEKEYLITQLKKIREISLKQQNLSEWSVQLCTVK